MSYRVVHYINQFFAQIGGEEMAHIAPELREGAVGPGTAFDAAWKGEATIVNTIVCGDSHFAEHEKESKARILAWVKEINPDLFIAGPAFNAGRYGYACANIALAVKEELGIPVLTGMYEENPGADLKDKVLIVATTNNAAGMRKAAPTMAKLAMKLMKGEKLGASCEDGYMNNGIRVNFFEKERKRRVIIPGIERFGNLLQHIFAVKTEAVAAGMKKDLSDNCSVGSFDRLSFANG